MPATHIGYVVITQGAQRGTYAMQLPSKSQWGFLLAKAEGEDSQTWEGGHGLATEWEKVERLSVPREVREEMDWLLEGSGFEVCGGCGEVKSSKGMTANAEGANHCAACMALYSREDERAKEESAATELAERERREAALSRDE